jgi:hypothetical protein
MKTIAYTIADQNNLVFAQNLERSFKHFHPDIEFRIIGEKELAESGVPKPDVFYMAAPLFAQKLMDEGYTTLLKIDADSVITGSLNHILENDLYDVGVVYNWNRVDPARYGEIGLATIQPREYYNNGFVVLRNYDFVQEWLSMCTGKHFNRMPFREQGFLNILCHYGRFTVRCFDDSPMWHGLISKGEWSRCVLKNGELVLPTSPEGYPNEEKIIKVIHWAGGANEPKFNYRIYFSEECSAYIDGLIT